MSERSVTPPFSTPPRPEPERVADALELAAHVQRRRVASRQHLRAVPSPGDRTSDPVSRPANHERDAQNGGRSPHGTPQADGELQDRGGSWTPPEVA